MVALTSKEKKRIQKKILQLYAEIERHNRLYYKDSRPEISDFEYDCLKSELLHLESLLSDEMVKIGIGDDRSGNLLTRKHYAPMLSLENTYDLDDIFDFDVRIRKLLAAEKNIEYVVEPKIDGLAVNLIYEKGQLKYALTRGNGFEGDDVTENVKTIEDLPWHIANAPDLIEIRGEVYMDNEIFQKINMERADTGEFVFANARNLASGTLKLMDSEAVRLRHLKILLYGIGTGNCLEKQSEIYPFLQELGFVSQTYYHIITNLDDIATVIRRLDWERKQLPYATDGVVFKVNERALQEKLGVTAKAPRWAFAYKFEPERAETILRSVTFQVGRTGMVTPVAELEPVYLSGSCVARATLHNADDIVKKDIRIGDTVIVEKSGEIIPAIVGIKLENRPQNGLEKLIFPKNCPHCNTQLIRLPEEVAWRCPNVNCQEQIIHKIIYFASKTAMNIDGFGESVVRKLVEFGKVKTPADIYVLQKEDLYLLENFGEKSVNRLLSNIERSKKIELWRFINGLGIPLIGEKMAKDLANHFHHWDALAVAPLAELGRIRGVGRKVAQGILNYFRDSKNLDLLQRLQKVGFEFEKIVVQYNPHFAQKVFVLTGTMQQFTRDQAKKLIEKNGGFVANTLSTNVNVLIAGSDAGQKLDIAHKKNIPIWTEIDFAKKLTYAAP
ncbi:MAG: NAD-dependent DNA ligase LigA [Puniceicoccales bacterium]|jgi:DNA ligase (NAD+)|nr:NAD-dependent DNA ligase LigA [Puniceicoccales bacterium]